MAYIAPPGKAPKGEGAEDLTRIRVVYAEAGFECVALVPPGADLKSSVKMGMEHGINEAARQLQLPKKDLRAGVSAPLFKEDGSSIPAEEWASNHFIVVEMKSEKKANGVLGKYRKQHTYLETVMRDGIKGLTASTSKAAIESSDSSTAAATDSVQDLLKKQAQLQEENTALKAEITTLKAEITTLKTQMEALEKKVEEDNTASRTTIEALEKKVHDLSGMELIMMRKMVEHCREKSVRILQEQNVAVPSDWNIAICDSSCIETLRDVGLTTGLQATRFGKNSQQRQGSTAAHEIAESVEAYATIVCKMIGDRRERMKNVFEFVFDRKAEDVAFDDVF